MGLDDLAYPTLVYAHLLLFVLWLGADVGVFLLGQHFRKRNVYSLDQRIALLKLLVIVDLTPRTAWALMVPLSLTVSYVGGWWDLPAAIVWAAWAIAAFWLWLVFDARVAAPPLGRLAALCAVRRVSLSRRRVGANRSPYRAALAGVEGAAFRLDLCRRDHDRCFFQAGRCSAWQIAGRRIERRHRTAAACDDEPHAALGLVRLSAAGCDVVAWRRQTGFRLT
jgi:hypothetical protein